MNGGYVFLDAGLSASIYGKIMYLDENPSTSPTSVEYNNAYESVRKCIETEKPILISGGSTTQEGFVADQIPQYAFGNVIKTEGQTLIALFIGKYQVNFTPSTPNGYTIVKVGG